MALQWVLIDLLTGAVKADLPDIAAQSPLRQTIGQYESNSLTMPVSTAPTDWLTLTAPYQCVFIALDDETGQPVWGGIPSQRVRTQADVITFPVSTVESHFDRRYISPAVSATVITTPTYGYYAGWDQNALCGDLVTRYAKAGTKPGMAFRVDASVASAQAARTQIYSDSDDKTLYGGLTELRSILNGPEWLGSWEWSDQVHITPVFTVRDRIGRAVRPNAAPAATFSLPGCVSAVTFLEDYTSGKGANDVTAAGAGQGNSRPSGRQVATNFGNRPTVEFRFSVPTVGVLTVGQIQALQGYATSALGLMGGGISQLILTADTSTAPQFGTDWNLGDDIGYELGGIDAATGLDLAPAFPGGLSGVARVIGVDRADTTVAPIILVPNPTLTVGSF